MIDRLNVQRYTTPRLVFLYVVLFCILMTLTALFYFQRYLGLEPCPLCVLQRVFVMATGGVALVGFVHNPGIFGRRGYAGLALLPVLGGLVTAGRHMWLQRLPPDKLPECGPGLEFMLDVFPFFEALKMIFMGSGECAEIQWSLLGLSIPGWTLVGFAMLMVALVYLLFTKRLP